MFPPLISILVSKDHVYKVLPSAGLMMNRMAILHQNSGELGDQPPLPSRFPSTLEISLRLRLGKSLGHRGWISQYLPRFDGARIQSFSTVNPPNLCCVLDHVKYAYPSRQDIIWSLAKVLIQNWHWGPTLHSQSRLKIRGGAFYLHSDQLLLPYMSYIGLENMDWQWQSTSSPRR